MTKRYNLIGEAAVTLHNTGELLLRQCNSVDEAAVELIARAFGESGSHVNAGVGRVHPAT